MLFRARLLTQGIVVLQLTLCALGSQQAGSSATTRSPHGSLNIPCQDCHSAQAWKPIRAVPEFDHRKTGFPLRGLHSKVACTGCHLDRVFANVGSQCQDCHADIHRRKNGAQCDMCHRDTGWQVSIHNINEHQDRFPLIGAHATVDCYSCHKVGTVGQFNRQGLSTECVSCHMTAFRRAKNPNHLAMGYPTDCQQCHTTMDTWSDAAFRRTSTLRK
ncbi:MAG TPA: hypothetical protein VGF08_00480 [Terriglobales bacterium]